MGIFKIFIHWICPPWLTIGRPGLLFHKFNFSYCWFCASALFMWAVDPKGPFVLFVFMRSLKHCLNKFGQPSWKKFSPSFLFFFFFLPSLLDPFQLPVQHVLVLFCFLPLTIIEIFFPCRMISHQKHLDKIYCNQKTIKYNWYYKFRLILNTWNNNCHLKFFWVDFTSKPCLKFQKGKFNLYKKQ